MATSTRVRFENPDQALHQELRAVVDAYFEARGIPRSANGAMVAKTVFWLGLAAALFVVLVSGVLPAWLALLGAGALGVTMAAVGFNVGHDAIHGAWSENPRVNAILSRCFDLLGASSTTWAEAHNFVHHTYTNVPGVDHDLDPGPFMHFYQRENPGFIYRFQHIYAFALYFFTFVVWVFKKDFVQIFAPDPRTGKRHGARAIADVFFWKAVHFGLFLALPLAVSGYAWWMVLVGYAAVIATAGLTLAVIFQLAHVVEATAFPVPDADRVIHDSWAAHQLRTTANFAPDSAFWNFFTGGLNHQVEHHLFYKICHIHYPALAPLVREVALRHGLPYHVAPTFTAALLSHVRTLKRFGRPATATAETTTATPTVTTEPTAATAAAKLAAGLAIAKPA